MRVLPRRAGHARPDRRSRGYEGHFRATARPADRRLRARQIRMTTLIDLRPAGSAPEPDDAPRPIRKSLSAADLVFRWGTTGIGAIVLVLIGAVGAFLGYQVFPTLRDYGLRF